ncbi:MAG: prephenate dehydratase [Gammaproteobacteria bacterium]|jgi:chorismate mutase/prephenate dehydratase|nr:prephenate dehydratase [Gammaproteobacteria bacterium]MBT6482407.1 prephenate dehydratase [Gammaproteobacteria bacterium]
MSHNTDTSALGKVAYLGPEGTYSQLAAMEFFGAGVELVDCASIDDVFIAVEEGRVSYGIVPVENSTEGAINNTQDCLVDSTARIIGEQVVSIEHSLLAQEASSKADIKKIASHKQSLAQCRTYLTKNFPIAQQVECSSNAEAAILAQADGATAAIASELAGQIYSLRSLESRIQDKSNNRTRFLVLALEETEASGYDKTSILVYTENKPGALFRVLKPFEKLGLSLTRIETRPSKKEAWEYVFFIDFEGHVDDEATKSLFSALKLSRVEVKVLGSYPLCK